MIVSNNTFTWLLFLTTFETSGINESVICTNFGEASHVIVNWDTKQRQFLAWKFINSPITRKPLVVQSWNLYTMWVLINGLCKPSLEAPGYVTKILRARKWTSLLTNINCISENTDFDMENDLGFLSTLSIAFLFVICSLTPNYEYYFSAFSSFFLLFFFFFSSYLLLNCWRYCIQSLSDWRYQEGLVPDTNWGCQVERIPSIGPKKFKLLNIYS